MLHSKPILVFDTSALIFAKSIMSYVQKNYEIKITPLVSKESGISEGVSIEELGKKDKDFAYNLLRIAFFKDYAISYKRGRKVKHAAEIEALALARRFDSPIVFHEKRISSLARMYNIKSVRLIDLPDKVKFIPDEELIKFYDTLCKQRSSKEACEKLEELRKSKD